MLLTTKQATDFYKVSRPTLIKLAKTKKVKALKIGKQWRFVITKEDLEK